MDTCKSAIDNGFTSVMMDGSLQEDGKTPADFAYNVKVTREYARSRTLTLSSRAYWSIKGKPGPGGVFLDLAGAKRWVALDCLHKIFSAVDTVWFEYGVALSSISSYLS